MPPPKPFLTIVAGARNDDHGGDLLLRLQTFVRCLAQQCDKVRLPVELLLVEWNPPADRPSLTEAIEWPSSAFCECRVVTVSSALHRRFSQSIALPLHQMIAKNVGIRRARADFVLSTNIDLIFSTGLMEWLATRVLQPGVLIRVDRHDVPRDVMQLNDLDQQLEYCARNVIRVNARHGTFSPSAPTLQPERESQPIAAERQAADSASPPDSWLPRLIQDDWPILSGFHRAQRHWARARWNFRRALRTGSPFRASQAVRFSAKALFRTGRTWTRVAWRSLTRRAVYSSNSSLATCRESPPQPSLPIVRESPAAQSPPDALHLNACGDFTLLAKSDWLRLGGYAEFAMYPLHIDSLFLHRTAAAGIRQQIVDHPVYHIEHFGSWTPEEGPSILKKFDALGVEYLTYDRLLQMVEEVRRLPEPGPFNDSPWGLRDCELPEVTIPSHIPRRGLPCDWYQCKAA